jgi:5-(carboxyamino)imidazole ribonucleotide synthase
VMVNLLGYEDSQDDYLSKRQEISAIPNAFVHWYGKQSRIGRKLGHVTVLVGTQPNPTPQSYRQQTEVLARQVEAIWSQ